MMKNSIEKSSRAVAGEMLRTERRELQDRAKPHARLPRRNVPADLGSTGAECAGPSAGVL